MLGPCAPTVHAGPIVHTGPIACRPTVLVQGDAMASVCSHSLLCRAILPGAPALGPEPQWLPGCVILLSVRGPEYHIPVAQSLLLQPTSYTGLCLRLWSPSLRSPLPSSRDPDLRIRQGVTAPLYASISGSLHCIPPPPLACTQICASVSPSLYHFVPPTPFLLQAPRSAHPSAAPPRSAGSWASNRPRAGSPGLASSRYAGLGEPTSLLLSSSCQARLFRPCSALPFVPEASLWCASLGNPDPAGQLRGLIAEASLPWFPLPETQKHISVLGFLYTC